MGLSIQVKHNMEMGHRLSLQPDSKCYHLHGHSWWAHLTLEGPVDDTGMILEFGEVKKLFRDYLDTNFDHHMLLNIDDPLIRNTPVDTLAEWGVVMMPGGVDPTVENVAEHLCTWAVRTFPTMDKWSVYLQEASVNAATASWVRGEE